MKRKFLFRLAPVLVVAAFAVLPAAAQAVHWQKNGTNTPTGEKLDTISWGTLTLESSAGNISCKNAAAAKVSNSATEALQETIAFTTWECKPLTGECFEEGLSERATPSNYPWTGNVSEPEAGIFKSKFANIVVNIECYKPTTPGKEELAPNGTVVGNLVFKTGPVLGEEGASEPENKNGSTPGKPSEILITGEPGHLYAETEIEIPLRVRNAPGKIEKESKDLTAAAGVFKCKVTVPASTCPETTGTIVEEFPPAGTGVGIEGALVGPGATVEAGSTETDLKLTVASKKSNAELGLPAGFPVHFKTPGAAKVKTAIKGTTKGSLKTEIYSAATPIPLITLGP